MENKHDEKAVLKEMQKEFKKVLSLFSALTNLKINDVDYIVKVEKALRGIPSSESLVEVIESLKHKYSKIVEEIKQQRAVSFKKYETDFLKAMKDEGKAIREITTGWRIGYLEFETKKNMGQVRFKYNREPLGVWRSIASGEDISRLEKAALELLEKATLPDELLIQAVELAYTQVITKRQSNLAPILDFYREFRLALFRMQLENKGPHIKVKFDEFPKWAFLYNLDKYREISLDIPIERRLGFQTGSQQEVSQGKGVVLNGLNAMDDYQVMCYVISAKGR